MAGLIDSRSITRMRQSGRSPMHNVVVVYLILGIGPLGQGVGLLSNVVRQTLATDHCRRAGMHLRSEEVIKETWLKRR